MKVINIIGWGGSGKSVLHSLLDSHYDILSDPIHTKIFDSLLEIDFDSPKCKLKDVRVIRECLKSRGYYNIEAISLKKELSIPLSSNPKDMITIPFPFNFYRFDSKWIKGLEKIQKWNANSVASLLYDEYAKELDVSDACSENLAKKKYVSTMGKVSLFNLKKINLMYPGSKTILVKRSVEDIISTRINRPTPKGFCKTDIRREWLDVILRGEIQKINNYYQYIEAEVKSNPQAVKVINFNDLVLNTEVVMKDVADFLNIKYIDLLISPSCFGLDVSSKQCSYIGAVNDTAKKLLSRKRRLIIKAINRASKVSKLFSVYSPIVSLAALKIYTKLRAGLNKWK